MITLKAFLAEPQTMYDGGLVYMQDGGDPLEDKAIDLRQRAENIPDIIERPSSSTVIEQLPVTEQQLPITTKPTLPVPKSLESKLPRIVGTILKARKYTNPLGIASQVLDLIPQETKTAAVDYLKNTPAYELFGLEHYDLEYWKALGDMVNDVLDTGIDQDEYGVEELWSEFQHYLGLLHEEEVAIEAEPTSLLELPNKQIETGPTEEINAEYVRNLDLYHATTATKLIGGKLKASKVGVLGQGVYATPDTEYAGIYAEGEGGNIHPIKANIENPLIVRIKGRFHDYTPARVFEELGVSKEKAYEMAERNNEEHGGDFTTQFKSRARKQGYDSIVLVNDETNTMQEIVVFDPDKIVPKFKPMYDGGIVQHMSEGGLGEYLFESSPDAPIDEISGQAPLSQAQLDMQPEEGYGYGNILPIRRQLDPDTGQPVGDMELTWPTMAREFGTGLIDLVRGVKTGVLTPEAFGSLMDLNITPALLSKPNPNLIPMIMAWHATPHKFDQFDITKIGTGEGAQVFGKGLYFAGHLGTGKVYRDQFAGKTQIKVGKHGIIDHDDHFGVGKPKPREIKKWTNDPDEYAYEISMHAVSNIAKRISREMDTLRSDRIIDNPNAADLSDEVLLKQAISNIEKYLKTPANNKNNFGNFKYSEEQLINMDKVNAIYLENLNRFKELGITPIRKEAQLYRVKLDVEEEDFLDWDLPLSKQSDKVKKLFDELYDEVYDSGFQEYMRDLVDGDPTGQELYKMLGRYQKQSDFDTSKQLNEKGIFGIKYLDEGSRPFQDSPKGSEKTFNYVMFDDNKIEKVDDVFNKGGQVRPMYDGGLVLA